MDKPGFIGGPDGAVVRYDPKTPQSKKPEQALSRHQRATVYFKAVRFVRQLLCSVGFQDEADCGHSGFSISMDNFLLEMTVKEPPNMAHVTSFAGYSYDPNKINAKVTNLCPTDGKDYVIQVMATQPNGWSSLPTFIVMRHDTDDLLREAFMNCLMTARNELSKSPRVWSKIQAALAKRDLELELEKLKAQDTQALPFQGDSAP
jgi:hypothetical protein